MGDRLPGRRLRFVPTEMFAPSFRVARVPLQVAPVLLVLACGAEAPTVAPAPPPSPAPVAPPVPTPQPTPTPMPECPASAEYGVTFRAVWDAASHGNRPPFPSGAHFSRVVGATHLPEVSFWTPGGIATPGIESMAETGGVSALCREIRAEADRGGSGLCLNGAESSFRSPGSVSFAFDADAERPLITLVSMIAPSPDWFVGVNGVPLMEEEGCWRERIELELVGYDAGTDSGATFTASDADVTPHEQIGPIRELPPGIRERPFATLVLVRMNEPG